MSELARVKNPDPARQGEDPIIFTWCTALQREQQSLRHHGQALQCLHLVCLAISPSSLWDLAASTVRLIDESHQQEVLGPIRPERQGQGHVVVRLCVNIEA